MTTFIKDGTGNGFAAKVTSDNELKVRARSVENGLESTREGNMYIISTPFLTVTPTGGRFTYLQYTDTTQNLALDRIDVSWNGGSTNFNRPLYVNFVAGDTTPTTNIQTITPFNAFSSSAKNFTGTILAWDGVGDGMTGHTPGLTVTNAIFNQGFTSIETKGTFIISSGVSIGAHLRGEEAGEASITIWMYNTPIEI